MELEEGDILVSFDVKSLFTKVPVKEAIDVVCDKLQTDETLSQRTELSVSTIRELIELCFKCSYFQWKNTYYQQTEGAPMGLSLSVAMANAYMEHWQETVLRTSPLKPSYFKRYVDDMCAKWKHGRPALDAFHNHCNSVHEDIQVTMEVEDNGRLPHLDVLIDRQGDRITTSVYRKPTHTNLYTKYHSHHPDSTKLGIMKCLLRRAEKVCSPSEHPKEIKHIENTFVSNGYPEEVVTRTIQRFRPNQPPVNDAGERKKYLSIPYIKGLSERISKVLAPHDIIVAHKSQPTLKQLLCHLKDKLPPGSRKGAIYKITCNCGKSYIGETKRPLCVRIGEHVTHTEKGNVDKSAIAQHASTCPLHIRWDDTSTLGYDTRESSRLYRENIEIRLHGTAPGRGLNRNLGRREVSPIWQPIMAKLSQALSHHSSQSQASQGAGVSQPSGQVLQ